MSDMPDVKAHLVRTEDDRHVFRDWLTDALGRGRPLTIDTETMGLDWTEPNFTRLWQIGDLHAGWAIPVRWHGQLIAEAMRLIAESGIDIVMHNAPHDMHAIEAEGWVAPSWAQVHDTMTLMHLHQSNLDRQLKYRHAASLVGEWVTFGKNALSARAKELGLMMRPKVHQDHKSVWRHIAVDDPMYWQYGAFDTVVNTHVFEALQPTRDQFDEAYERERHYQAVMFRAECRGLHIDQPYTRRLQAQMEQQIAADLLYLQSEGLQNPGSDLQVIALLEGNYGWVPQKFTDSGRAALDKNVKAELASAGGHTQEVIEALVRWERMTKWKAVYVDKFLSSLTRHGVVHPSINTMEARTGRSSITGPPLQTLPSGDPLIRKCVKAPKGHVWVSIDYSAQEPRLLAHYGRSPELIDFILNGDGKIHDMVAGNLFGAGYSPEQRAISKAFGLGRSYGAGVDTLSVASGQPPELVEQLLPEYDRIMGLAALNEAVEQAAASRSPLPYITTSGGRRQYSDPDKIYTLVNYLMQGSGADVLKDAVIRLDQEGLADFIQVPVHDELTFCFPKDEWQGLSQQCASLMEDHTFSVPLPVEISKPGKSWGAVYE